MRFDGIGKKWDLACLIYYDMVGARPVEAD